MKKLSKSTTQINVISKEEKWKNEKNKERRKAYLIVGNGNLQSTTRLLYSTIKA